MAARSAQPSTSMSPKLTATGVLAAAAVGVAAFAAAGTPVTETAAVAAPDSAPVSSVRAAWWQLTGFEERGGDVTEAVAAAVEDAGVWAAAWTGGGWVPVDVGWQVVVCGSGRGVRASGVFAADGRAPDREKRLLSAGWSEVGDGAWAHHDGGRVEETGNSPGLTVVLVSSRCRTGPVSGTRSVDALGRWLAANVERPTR